MSSDYQVPPANPRWMTIVGWILTALPALMLIASAGFKFFMAGPEAEENLRKIGWRVELVVGLGILELACAIAFLIPRTAVLGAVLLTGYLGGAIATHVRVGDPLVPSRIVPFMLGIVIWLAMWFRDPHVRAILPMRMEGVIRPGLMRVGFAFTCIVLGLVIAIALQPPEYRVERSMTIDAPPAEVFEHVNDFRKWEAWSPWVKSEPNAQYLYEGASSGKGAICKWAGDKIGEGTMTIIDSVPPERIKVRLEFRKPMQANGEAEFFFKAENQKTTVTWTFQGEHVVLSKAMSLFMSMESMLGETMEKGLANLKQTVESKR